jgi:hypothetical protein
MLSQIRPHQFEYFSRLSVIVTHGRKYLSEGEYQQILKVSERQYFGFLGQSALERKGPKLWEFHRKHLASIAYSLDFLFMSKWVLAALFDYIGNPKRTMEFVWQRRGRIRAAAYRFIEAMRRTFIRKQVSEKP